MWDYMDITTTHGFAMIFFFIFILSTIGYLFYKIHKEDFAEY